MDSGWHYIHVPVVAKQRPRLGRRRKAFTPEKTKTFETAIADWYNTYVAERFGALPLGVEVEIDREGFWVHVYELDGFHRPIGIRGDVDNYVKSILDGLNTVAWDDDKQVEEFSVKFLGDIRPVRKVAVQNVDQ